MVVHLAMSGKCRRLARGVSSTQRSCSASTVNCCVPSPTTYSPWALALAMASMLCSIRCALYRCGPHRHTYTAVVDARGACSRRWYCVNGEERWRLTGKGWVEGVEVNRPARR